MAIAGRGYENVSSRKLLSMRPLSGSRGRDLQLQCCCGCGYGYGFWFLNRSFFACMESCCGDDYDRPNNQKIKDACRQYHQHITSV